MIMYERLRRIYVSLREEERACQVLAAVAVHALSRSFDMAVEQKQGISNLELLYQEISRAERAKELRREQKKLKKKLKKIEKKEKLCRKSVNAAADNADSDAAEADGEEEEDRDEVDLEMVDEAVDLCDELDEELNKLVDIMDKNLRTDEKGEFSISDKPHLATAVVSKSPAQKKRKQKKQKKHKQPIQQSSGSKKKEIPQQQQQRVPTVEQSLSANGSHFGSCCDLDTNVSVEKCDVCLTPQDHCPCENDVRDSGYGSELLTPDNSPINSVASTPEGSEVSCSEGFCNHENGQDMALEEDHDHHMYDLGNSYMWGDSSLNQKCGSTNWLSLQQMLVRITKI